MTTIILDLPKRRKSSVGRFRFQQKGKGCALFLATVIKKTFTSPSSTRTGTHTSRVVRLFYDITSLRPSTDERTSTSERLMPEAEPLPRRGGRGKKGRKNIPYRIGWTSHAGLHPRQPSHLQVLVVSSASHITCGSKDNRPFHHHNYLGLGARAEHPSIKWLMLRSTIDLLFCCF